MSTVKLVGLPRVIAKLTAIDSKAEANLAVVVKTALQEIIREAKRNSPELSGRYKKMLKYRTDGLSGYAAPLRRGNRTSAIGHLLEFGTVHARAIPHLFPAFRLVIAVMEPRIIKAMRDAGR